MNELMKLNLDRERARRDVYDCEYVCQIGGLKTTSSHFAELSSLGPK